jgi:hypothetical protein
MTLKVLALLLKPLMQRRRDQWRQSLLRQQRQGWGHWIPWVVVEVEARSMTLEPIVPLFQRRQGQWCQGPSCCWGSVVGVDDAGAPRAIEVVEAGSMMSAPLGTLLQQRQGWWRRNPSGRCYDGGNDDMLLCRRKWMCATLFGASISGVSISLQMVERVVSFMAAFSYEVLSFDRIFVIWNIYLQRPEGMKCSASRAWWLKRLKM